MFLPRPEPLALTERPVGNIVVGVVTEVGSDVSDFSPGDRVFGYGPICEEHQLPDDSWRPLDGLSETDAVCSDPAHVAIVAVRDGNVRIGDAVAVFGLGAIGLMTVQIAACSGAITVIAVDPIAGRRTRALALGADLAVDPDAEDAGLRIKRATGNHGVDVAIETSGNAAALHQAIRAIRQCGTIVHVPYGPKNASALQLDEEFHVNRPTIIGSQAVWRNPDRSHPLWDEERARRAAIDLFRRGDGQFGRHRHARRRLPRCGAGTGRRVGRPGPRDQDRRALPVVLAGRRWSCQRWRPRAYRRGGTRSELP